MGKTIKKVKTAITLGEKIVSVAKSELNKEKEENYKKRAKIILEDIQQAKKTVILLERELQNFIKEISLEQNE